MPRGKQTLKSQEQATLPFSDAGWVSPNEFSARPFVKWVGGKGQLLAQFASLYPDALLRGDVHTYVEPFLGGGAVFFDIMRRFTITKAYLSDINAEIVLLYRVVQQSPDQLIDRLDALSAEYSRCDCTAREAMYYRVRQEFNDARRKSDWLSASPQSSVSVQIASELMFLNRTCFNGLFRLNRKGDFNVPCGRYVNPRIVDKENVMAASRVLQPVTIQCASYEHCREFIDDRPAFVYFDPPYRPISKTAQFTSYSRDDFSEEDQKRLAQFFRSLANDTGSFLMLSNSDPANVNPHDTFFEEQFSGFNITHVSALRNINSNGAARGAIKEIVVTNYPVRREPTSLSAQ